MAYFVYILQSLTDGTYNVGSTHNVNSRLERHNQGRSQYTQSKRPWQLVHFEEFSTKFDALKRENQIKRRKIKRFIQSLIKTSEHVNAAN
ncbi:MAG: GIY-YIG nuclease family protein [Deltaproteobacteria bacterium]|nr:GIY-YIG nuclease family protein [Deltaproteobacteria bacterium]MBW2478782.1 GIY-YIG nuclease family protein [Deltaproteobacteria bacterium]